MKWKPKSNILEWKKWSKHPPSKCVFFWYFMGRQIDRSQVFLFSCSNFSQTPPKNFKNWWLLEGRKSVQKKDIPSNSYDVPIWLDVKNDRNHSIDSRIPTTCTKPVQRKFSFNFFSFFWLAQQVPDWTFLILTSSVSLTSIFVHLWTSLSTDFFHVRMFQRTFSWKLM